MPLPEVTWRRLVDLGLAELLMCEWGKDVRTEEDPTRCTAQATGIIALHGTPLGEIHLKFCDRHRQLVIETTEPHKV